MAHTLRFLGMMIPVRPWEEQLRRYQHLEELAIAKSVEDPNAPFSSAIKIERGLEPAAGFENARAQDYAGRENTFLSSIAAARQEAQALFELSQDLGASLSLGETLSVFSVKLKPMVPYDAIAIYVRREEELVPEYVNGDNYRLFSALPSSGQRLITTTHLDWLNSAPSGKMYRITETADGEKVLSGAG